MIKLIETTNGICAVLKVDDHASRWAEERHSIVTDGTVRAALNVIKPGDVVVDAGANIGGWTLPFASAVGPTGKVLSFEPMPETFACLVVNARDYDQVKPYNCGLSDSVGIVKMIRDVNAGASRISDEGNRMAMITPLDGLHLERLDFMKLDVEGHELRLLKGAENTIKTLKPKMIIEINRGMLDRSGTTPEAVISLLADWDYEMRFLDPSHNLDMPQLDCLFVPQ